MRQARVVGGGAGTCSVVVRGRFWVLAAASGEAFVNGDSGDSEEKESRSDASRHCG